MTMNKKIARGYGLLLVCLITLILATSCSNPDGVEQSTTPTASNQYSPIKGLAMLTVDTSPIRSQPSGEADEIGRLSKGDVVQLIGISMDNNWYFVNQSTQSNGDPDGWVLKEFVIVVTPGPSSPEFTAQPTSPTDTQTPTGTITPTISPTLTSSANVILETPPTSTIIPSATLTQVTPPTSTPSATLIQVTPPTSTATPSATLIQVAPPTATATPTLLKIFTPTDTESPTTAIPPVPTTDTPIFLPPIQPPILPPFPTP
jgi:hypothetical protein